MPRNQRTQNSATCSPPFPDGPSFLLLPPLRKPLPRPENPGIHGTDGSSEDDRNFLVRQLLNGRKHQWRPQLLGKQGKATGQQPQGRSRLSRRIR